AALTPRPTARPLTQPAAVSVEGEPVGETALAEGEVSADAALRATYALARQEPARAGARPEGEAVAVESVEQAEPSDVEVASAAATEQSVVELATATVEDVGVREPASVVHRGMEGLVPEMR